MKKALAAFAITALLAACGNDPKTTTQVNKDSVTVDTTGLYNDQGKVMNLNGVNDTTITTVTTTTITKSANPDLNATEKAVVTKPKATAKKRSSSGTRAKSSSRGTGASDGTASQPTAQTTKKKGWSKAAKGTVIGAGSGAVIGAVVSKKKGKGAIIGGVLGAGVGYGVGRAKDKKDGRAN